jgi:pSer/pThr/pTyr-binding forkhead associated (FHA) protein
LYSRSRCHAYGGLLHRDLRLCDLPRNYSDVDIDHAIFALCAWIDEKILSSKWEGRNQWLKELLQRRLYKTANAGEEFVSRLDRLSPQQREVREVFTYCLSLGFAGPFLGSDGESRLTDYKVKNSKQLLGAMDEARFLGKALFPHAYPVATGDGLVAIEADADYEPESRGQATSNYQASTASGAAPVLQVETDAGSSTVEVIRDSLVIGRSLDCSIVVADPLVSRSHARIERRNQNWYVIDQGSGNGTFVNDQRISESLLTNGDRIRIGKATITFTLPSAFLSSSGIPGDKTVVMPTVDAASMPRPPVKPNYVPPRPKADTRKKNTRKSWKELSTLSILLAVAAPVVLIVLFWIYRSILNKTIIDFFSSTQ